MFAVQANGRAIRTVEGLAKGGTPHPLQQAFMDNHGLQCGFCTPGMIMATAALLQHTPNPSQEQIEHALEGNLCRCTGYVNIVAAVKQAAATLSSGAAK
jgi:carbon-monoxide dehydrogenase small subunit